MKILLTGSTGFVGKFLTAQILSVTNHTLVLPIRSKSSMTASQRFEKEFCANSLFGTDRLQAALQTRVTVLEGDVLSLKDLTGIDCVLHNAANVSFFEKLEVLKKDNVESMTHLAGLVEKSESISRFFYVSTCYVHPKDGSTGGKSELLPPDLKEDRFINSYAYSKYLAEQECVRISRRCPPEILRLSIVGAPLGYMGAHPQKGAAHLSILQAIFENRLPYVWIPSSVRLNILPVDCIVDQILARLTAVPSRPERPERAKMPEVIQLCAPPENPAYHLSLKDLSTFLELNYSHLLKQTVFSTVEAYEEFLAFVKGVVKVRQGIELLQKANRVIHCVAHTPWFECSIPPEAILDLSAQKHIELTVAFVLRGIHDRHLKRGIPLTNSDKIIECLEDPSISAQITLAPSVKALPLEDLKDRLYHALCVNRKTFATLDQSTHEWIYARDRPSQKKMVVEIPVLEEGVTPLQWAVRHPIPLSIGSRFLISPLDKSCVIQVNHMYSDGIGMLFHANSILESITREIGEPVVETRTPSQKSPRELSLFEDVWVGLRYGAWLLKDAVAQAFWLPEKPKLAGQKTVEEWQAPTKSIQLRQGMSFTESYLQDILNAKKDIHQAIRVCIPANTQSPLTRMKEPAQNQTSLYYQDFRADESESEFKEKFKVFRSATAKWIALILGGLLATWIPWLLKKCTNSIDILFSSLYVPPEFQKDLEPRIAIPLQSGQSLGVCCVTMEDTTFQCIVGRGTQVQKLASGLGKI